MDIDVGAFDRNRPMGESATHPLARPGERLALSLLLAGPGPPRRRFAPDTRPNAPSGASNRRFQDDSIRPGESRTMAVPSHACSHLYKARRPRFDRQKTPHGRFRLARALLNPR
jgi:hypothetical protein